MLFFLGSHEHFAYSYSFSLGDVWEFSYCISEGREWGVGSVVVESAFLGRPDVQSRGPKTLILKGFGAIWGKKSGVPQTQIQRPRIQRPILGPLMQCNPVSLQVFFRNVLCNNFLSNASGAPPPFRQVSGYTRSMRVPSCELWRSLANFGEPATACSRESPRHSLPVKVPSV